MSGSTCPLLSLALIHSQYAYLVFCWTRLNNVIHQDGHQFGHSVYASSICSVRGRAAYCLPLLLCLLHPLAGYRVYDVKNSQFVCCGCLFEVGVDFLDEHGLGLCGGHGQRVFE